MNAPERIDLPDIQSRIDSRDLAIDSVGVKGLRYPVTIRGNGVAECRRSRRSRRCR